MKLMQAITAAFAVKHLGAVAGVGDTDGINSMAMQKGGLGPLLTTMIISAPPMAAAFFQGTLGQFSAYSPFGHIKPEPPSARCGGGYGPPGLPTCIPPSGGRNRDTQSNVDRFSSHTASAGNAASSGYVAARDGMKQMDPPSREQS